MPRSFKLSLSACGSQPRPIRHSFQLERNGRYEAIALLCYGIRCRTSCVHFLGGQFCAILTGLLVVFDPAQMYRVFAGANLAPKKCNPSNSLFTPCHHDPCQVFFPKSKWLVTLKLRPPKCRKKAGMKQEQSSPSEGITLPSNRAQEQH